MATILDKLRKALNKPPKQKSYLRYVASGSFIRLSDARGITSVNDIRSVIQTMRNLAKDSQISTALSYYATDCTVPNSSNQIIWATSEDEDGKVADFINKLEIALKECSETEYWLELLFRKDKITIEQHKTLRGLCGSIHRRLIASITTAKVNGQH